MNIAAPRRRKPTIKFQTILAPRRWVGSAFNFISAMFTCSLGWSWTSDQSAPFLLPTHMQHQISTSDVAQRLLKFRKEPVQTVRTNTNHCAYCNAMHNQPLRVSQAKVSAQHCDACTSRASCKSEDIMLNDSCGCLPLWSQPESAEATIPNFHLVR